MAGNDRLRRVVAQPLTGNDVGVADAAALDPDPHLSRRWLTELPGDQRELPDPGDFERTIGGHDDIARRRRASEADRKRST